MSTYRSRFGRLQWKLTWSYTWVAALSFFIVEAIVLLALLALLGIAPFGSRQGLLDNEVLPEIADGAELITAFHLRQTPVDQAALQVDLAAHVADAPRTSAVRPYESEHLYSILVVDDSRRLLASVPRYAVLPPDGRLFDSTALVGDSSLEPLLDAALADQPQIEPVTHLSPDAQFIATARPIADQFGRPLGVQLAITRVPPPSTFVATILGYGGLLLLLFTLATAAVAALVGWRMARRLSKRLHHLSQTTAAWGQGDFSRSIRDEVGDEIGELGENLNRVAKELQAVLVANAQIAVLEERNRMARELHDTLAQGVAGLVLQLEAVKHHLHAGENARSRAIVLDAAAQARQTLHNARAALDDLRADAQAGVDFAAVASQQMRDFCRSHSLACHIAVNLPDALRLAPATAHHARHALAEMLTNIAKHAQATTVWLQIAVAEAELSAPLSVEVRDDGVGFDAKAVVQHGHYGLIGLEERARSVGGRLTIQSTPAVGTTVRLQLPVTLTGEEREAAHHG